MAGPPGERREKGPPLRLLGLGMELMAAVVGATLLGLWIDRRYGTQPWAVVVLGLVGIVGGLTNFVRQARRAAADQESTDSPSAAAESGRDDGWDGRES